MHAAQLKQVADALETAAVVSTSANPTALGYWKRIAVAAEALAGSSTAANDNLPGFLKRTSVALERLAGTSGTEENTNINGYYKRIVDALEVQAGAVTAGSLAGRMVVAAGDAEFGLEGLFASGEAGAWYDPSDLTSMYQDSAGTTPAVVGQPVGLLLDKRFGLARGAELLATGVPERVGTGSAAEATYDTSTGAATFARVTSSDYTRIGFNGLTSGATYEVDLTNTGSSQISVRTNGGATVIHAISSGAARVTVIVGTVGTSLTIQPNIDGTTASATIHSVRQISGNHATQSTTAAKPILRQDSNGKYYLEFDGVDDWLRAQFTCETFDRISAIRQISWTSAERIFGDGNGTAAGLFQNGVTPDLYLNAGLSIGPVSPPTGSNVVITERLNGASSRLALNSGSYVTGDAGTGTVGGISIANRSAGDRPAHMRLYGLLMIGRALTDGETQRVRNFMAGRAGVVL